MVASLSAKCIRHRLARQRFESRSIASCRGNEQMSANETQNGPPVAILDVMFAVR